MRHWTPTGRIFPRLWQGLCPDEIKIYPTQLLEGAVLYENWKRGEYQPYSTEELVGLMADIKPSIPRYCRVNRIIRDIPSTHVVAGNKRTSLRQDVQAEMKRRGTRCNCIRCREVRGGMVDPGSLRLDDLVYSPDFAEEHFLSFVTPDDQVAGFLRLSFPGTGAPVTGLADLAGAAIIREVHVYGQSLRWVGNRRAPPSTPGWGRACWTKRPAWQGKKDTAGWQSSRRWGHACITLSGDSSAGGNTW